MKADLDEKGTLVITGETAVECFALTHWFRSWEKSDATLLVQTMSRDLDNEMVRGLQVVDPKPPT